ncbi:PEP-utilizing enzyme [Kribbella aluminosa]
MISTAKTGDLLSTKALTLRRLAPLIASATIDRGHIISRGNWRTRGPIVVGFLAAEYQGSALIVRSSATGEDTETSSAAGKYDSFAIPEQAAPDVLQAAIDQVFSSYGDDRDDSYVFVQRYIAAVSAAAVVTTRVAATGAPYYVLAVDEVSGTSDAITSGRGPAETWYLAHGRPETIGPPLVRQLMRTVEAVENATGSDQLDLELLLDTDRRTHLLQVRPLVLRQPPPPDADRAVRRAVDTCAYRLEAERRNGQPALLGLAPWFSNMADWNPAEMIGQRPRPLAMSLYREVITNRTWAIQRAQYGYRDLCGIELLHDFAGQPYIDVRASLLSFIPARLPFAAARRIVGIQLEQLAAEPHLHDRIEFDVATTATTFDLDERLDTLTAAAGLLQTHRAELRAALTAITAAGLGRVDRDARQVGLAALHRIACRNRFVNPLHRADYLLREIQTSIAVPFAHTARAAFLATALTRTAVTAGLASTTSVEQFMQSLSTVSAQLRADGAAVADGTLDWETFVQTYGHLRPGTYDPAVPRYGDAPELYLRPFVTSASPLAATALDLGQPSSPLFTADPQTVTSALTRIGLNLDATALTGFIRSAITARELGKFELSAWISDILTCLQTVGESLGHTPDDVAFWRLRDVRGLRAGSLSAAQLRDRVEVRRERYAVTQRLHLPATMADPLDVRCFATGHGQPTYVGTGSAAGLVKVAPQPDDDLDGIVVLTSADPGFEWLFSRRVRGIITLYGGANSHLAVRCAEAGVPAAMGVGQTIYDQLTRARSVHLNCASQTIDIVS